MLLFPVAQFERAFTHPLVYISKVKRSISTRGGGWGVGGGGHYTNFAMSAFYQ